MRKLKINGVKFKPMEKHGKSQTNLVTHRIPIIERILNKENFMHNNCYIITLCSSKKREQVIILDAKVTDAAKEKPTGTSQSPVHSHSLLTSLLQKKNMVIHSTGFICKRNQCVWHMKHPNTHL